jgi:hypothetical protein
VSGLRKGFYGICYDLSITAVFSIHTEESDEILCVKNSQIHTGHRTEKKNKRSHCLAKTICGLKNGNAECFTDIFFQERKLIYTETIVQDVIVKYSAMCWGKYKQFEGKSDFIRATPFQYLTSFVSRRYCTSCLPLKSVAG